MQLTTTIIALLASVTSVAGQAPEELFLDLAISDVLNHTSGTKAVEPWASYYVQAVSEGRYGDAIYARYNMDGLAMNGVYKDTNRTVQEEIQLDAIGYHQGYPEIYAETLSFFSSNHSVADSKPEIIEAIRQVPNSNGTATLAERDITYGIKCSGDYLAPYPDCHNLLEHTGESRTIWYGTRRRMVNYWGDCHLRLGPLSGRQDTSQRHIHHVANFIFDDCARSKACCNGLYVSGYSPANTGHRKICLSKKSTGCH